MTLAQYPALLRALCAFHGRTVPGDIEIPQPWSARFRLANEVCTFVTNPAWFATVNTPQDMRKLCLSSGHVKCLQQVFFEWEPRV